MQVYKLTYKVIWLIIMGVYLMLHLGCEKALLRPDGEASPQQVFDHLWNDVNDRYAFFNVKNIDWEDVRDKYRPMVNDDMSDESLFDVLSEMLFELRDGHVNITTNFNRSRNWEWFQDFPINYNQNIIDRSYLDKDFQIIGPFRAKSIDTVLYVNYRSFGDAIDVSHMNSLMNLADRNLGLIIDIRSNGGGSLSNAYRMMGALTDRSRIFARERIKTGSGPDDFSPWNTLSYSPERDRAFDKPVVLLCNRGSYSASTFFAQMIKVLPNGVIIGDQTGGGGGIPVFGELPNGWMYRFSATQTINPEGQHLEFGVEPDIFIDMTEEDELQDIDTIIEAALDYIRQL